MKKCRKCNILKSESDFRPKRATCKECYAIYKAKYDKAYRENNKDVIAEIKHKHYLQNKEKYCKPYSERVDSCRKYYKNNQESIKQKSKLWHDNNSERSRELKSKWQSLNRGACNAKTAKRRASKLQATPGWADLDRIRDIYKNCPEGYHVDHIIPLQGRDICGLHVPENLQYLTAEENIRKGNKF